MKFNSEKPSIFSAIDLFAGCGGLTLGLREAGYQVLAAVKRDLKASATYKLNHRSTHIITSDIRDLDPLTLMTEIGIKAGQLSLLVGCPPCQGFSRLRTKNGASSNVDEQNGLIGEFTRFAIAMRPKMLMLENVK